jgi:hypothetical protein
LVGVLEGFLFFASQTFAGIFEISTEAEQLVLEGSDFRRGIGLGGGLRGGWSGLAIGKNDLGLFGGRVPGVLGVLGFHSFKSEKCIRIRCKSY